MTEKETTYAEKYDSKQYGIGTSHERVDRSSSFGRKKSTIHHRDDVVKMCDRIRDPERNPTPSTEPTDELVVAVVGDILKACERYEEKKNDSTGTQKITER